MPRLFRKCARTSTRTAGESKPAACSAWRGRTNLRLVVLEVLKGAVVLGMRKGPVRYGPVIVLVLAAVAAACGKPASAPRSADVIVQQAVSQARAGSKAVLIEFGASWCTWCRSFEAFVKAPDT